MATRDTAQILPLYQSKAKTPAGLDIELYRWRLEFLRQYVHGGTQPQFARHVGIPFKTWSSYERGRLMPWQALLLLHSAFPEASIDWILFGNVGNLPVTFWRQAKAQMPTRSRRRS